MLNKNWEKVYDPKDLDLWARLDATAPPTIYPFQKQILYSLLAKYYRTNKGNDLHPDSRRPAGAFLEMLRRTMADLEMAVYYRDKKNEEEWYEQRDREEDLGARLTREDEMKRDSSFRRISLREEIDLGRFWIKPDDSLLSAPEGLTHFQWLRMHQDLLTDKERRLIDRPPFQKQVLADGWIRISGGYVQIYSEKDLVRVAKFLKEHSFEEEADATVWITTANPEDMFPMKIKDIISKYGTEKYAASTVPNPLRKNYDYSGELSGPEWQSRVKHFQSYIDRFF